MLGSDVLAVRLGGIYALARLAQEHPQQYHIQIMLLFCAYVRRPPRGEPNNFMESFDHGEADDSADRDLSKMNAREDVRVILQVIGARGKRQHAIERESRVVLNMDGADLRGLQLEDADLSEVLLNKADLSNTRFSNVKLLRTSFLNALLTGAKFHDVDLSRALLKEARLCGAEFSRVGFTKAVLDNADMSSANLTGCNFFDADLHATDLSDAHLFLAGDTRVSFRKARLRDARLCRADFRHSDMLDAYLSQADLSGTIFSHGGEYGAIGLTQSQLDEASFDGENPPVLGNLMESTRKGFSKEEKPLIWKGLISIKPPSFCD